MRCRLRSCIDPEAERLAASRHPCVLATRTPRLLDVSRKYRLRASSPFFSLRQLCIARQTRLSDHSIDRPIKSVCRLRPLRPWDPIDDQASSACYGCCYRKTAPSVPLSVPLCLPSINIYARRTS
uniref:Uncharacterized protein n=1 Tax=Trichogramma kaykai TaxID=54128 RepID=A0ABD2WZC8_9HYME